MRKITLTIAEFVNFEWLAKQYGIMFQDFKVKHGEVKITAKDADLTELGF